MSVVAVYNMKGGVGKTTTAVNLSYLAAATGQRVLLWDLDPQAASTFALRVRPRGADFGKKSLKSGETLAAAIKETDYHNLDLLPADFAYRKLDRLLGHFGRPERVVTALLDALARDYDAVFLDCPAGFSLLTEGVFRAADAVLVPTIPTVLSLRTIARVIKWAERSDSLSELAAFFSMVDRRKTLHRRACEWSAGHPDVFLSAQIPYASVVEQMAVRRMPLAVFAPRDAATTAFAAIWAELQTRLQRRGEAKPRREDGCWILLRAVESLIARLESADGQEPDAPHQAPVVNTTDSHSARGRREVVRSGDTQPGQSPGTVKVDCPRPCGRPGADVDISPSQAAESDPDGGDIHFVHRFDTDRRDLQRCGYILELRERTGSLLVVAAQPDGGDDGADTTRRAQVQVDNCWATQILSGEISPLEALERRLGRPVPWLVESIRATVGERRLQRIDSRVAGQAGIEGRERPYADTPRAVPATIRPSSPR